MLKNYIKIAFRNIWRNKVYSLINILGLTLGITCSSLLFMLVIDELSFDSMHEKKDRIYRVVEIDDSKEKTRYYGITAPPVGPALADDYPEIEDFTRVFQFGGHFNFEKGDEKFHERAYYMADSNFFDVFDAEWVEGNPATALNEPYSMVIDRGWAQTLFGTTENVVGKTLKGGDLVYKITGVVEPLPQNTHLQYKVLVSLPTTEPWYNNYINNWQAYGAGTYLLLEENAQIKSLSDKIPSFIAKYFQPEQQRNFYLQSMNDIHFYSQGIEYATDEESRGQLAYIYIFIAIGAFMLLIACINYMNLATAKSLQRAKEIGVRKVSGAVRGQLILQFLSESVLIALVSLVLSIGLVDLVLPHFNELTNKRFIFNMETFGGIFFLLFIITLLVGLLSGTYPALFMSGLKPSNILKGSMNTRKGGVLLRKVLVITQFTLSIVMIIATIVAMKQLNFIQNKSLGFEKDQVMVVDINSGNVRNRFEAMKEQFASSPYIKEVAVSSRVPGEWKTIREIYVSPTDNPDSVRTSFMGFDHEMVDLYGMQIVAGSNFSGNPNVDSLHVLVNESAVEALG
ncbi:MAG: ABC transporter permease, partial [Fulvivirga sp.]|nr:ABC transporter permease [Fulvivirga sp.]